MGFGTLFPLRCHNCVVTLSPRGAQSKRMTERSSNAGYTLMEVVVVMVLLGILASTVALRIDFRGSQAQGTASLLEVHLLMVKEMAIASRQRVGLRLDPDNLRYEGIAIPLEVGQRNPFGRDPLRIDVDVDRLSTDLPGEAVFFDRFGRPQDADGNPLTRLYSIRVLAGSHSRRLFIEPETGYVHP